MLLHSSNDPYPFVLQPFGWEPGHYTPDHTHLDLNNCTSLVTLGEMTEHTFAQAHTAIEIDGVKKVAWADTQVRKLNSMAGFGYGQHDVPHQLANPTQALAGTLHLYEDMDGVTPGQQVNAKEKFETLLMPRGGQTPISRPDVTDEYGRFLKQ